VIFGKKGDSSNNNHSAVSIVLDVWQDKRLPVERTKIQADGKPTKKTSFSHSLPTPNPLGGRQEQTSGWTLTEFLKGYRAKRKIPTLDSCTRHTLPYIVLALSTEGAKNTFTTLSTNRSVILF